jgi:hypothetical protein
MKELKSVKERASSIDGIEGGVIQGYQSPNQLIALAGGRTGRNATLENNKNTSYMKTQRDGSSTRRELIDSSRKLLFTNISIMNKNNEAEVIRGDLL